jgi:hypothetical protein
MPDSILVFVDGEVNDGRHKIDLIYRAAKSLQKNIRIWLDK